MTERTAGRILRHEDDMYPGKRPTARVRLEEISGRQLYRKTFCPCCFLCRRCSPEARLYRYHTQKRQSAKQLQSSRAHSPGPCPGDFPDELQDKVCLEPDSAPAPSREPLPIWHKTLPLTRQGWVSKAYGQRPERGRTAFAGRESAPQILLGWDLSTICEDWKRRSEKHHILFREHEKRPCPRRQQLKHARLIAPCSRPQECFSDQTCPETRPMDKLIIACIVVRAQGPEVRRQ